MKQKENEDRADYLIRVVHAFMNETCAGSEHLEYDEADCDGLCLADDIDNEITFLKTQRDELLSALKETKKALEASCFIQPSPITDTLWMTKSETLFDFIDAAIAKADLHNEVS